MQTRKLGRTGPQVSQLGLGLMGMSDLYGPADEFESIATIHAALDAGITLLDTGDYYGMGHNELLIRDALRGRKRESALLSGHWSAKRSGQKGDFRNFLPRFQGENLQRNLALVEELRTIANAKGASVAQIAIAWVLSRGENIVPLVGARRRDRLSEALGALDVELTPEDLARLEKAVPPDAAAGDRYDAGQMAMLDSERARSKPA